MSRAMVCDRCGRFLKDFKGMIKVELHPFITYSGVAEMSTKSLDLCDQCAAEFIVWASGSIREEAADEQI